MKRIFLLIGPKGSGKSHIGMIFQKEFGIDFIRVENWVKDIKQERKVDDEKYIEEAFSLIESGINKEIKNRNSLVFESTGITKYFDDMLFRLQKKYKTILIKVDADDNICLNRVKSRDGSIHINVSDHDVRIINNTAKSKVFDFDFIIDNNNKTYDQLKEIIASIIKM